jgi:hypothetical protein
VNVGFDIIGVKVCPLNDSHVAVWGLMRCAVVVFSNPSAGENVDIIHMLTLLCTYPVYNGTVVLSQQHSWYAAVHMLSSIVACDDRRYCYVQCGNCHYCS